MQSVSHLTWTCYIYTRKYHLLILKQKSKQEVCRHWIIKYKTIISEKKSEWRQLQDCNAREKSKTKRVELRDSGTCFENMKKLKFTGANLMCSELEMCCEKSRDTQENGWGFGWIWVCTGKKQNSSFGERKALNTFRMKYF